MLLEAVDWRHYGKGFPNVGRIEMSDRENDRKPIKLPEKTIRTTKCALWLKRPSV
jgi:hypothetical protein